MMKNILHLAGAFVLLFFIVSNINYAQNKELTGATTNEVNGIYIASGLYSGVTYYQKGSIYLYRDANNYWVAGTVLGSVVVTNQYYAVASAADIPDGLTLSGVGNLGSGPGKPTVSNTALPVELTNFSAKAAGESIVLNWQTATEVNNYGFNIERMLSPTSGKVWEKIGFVSGYGNSNSPKKYSFIDVSTTLSANGTIKYRLKQIDTDGAFEYSDVVEVEIRLPEKFELSQNYPNPFNPSTNITYQLPEKGFVVLKVYNLLGEEVATLVNSNKDMGNYTVTFNASILPSGLYLYKLQVYNSVRALKFAKSNKMILLK